MLFHKMHLVEIWILVKELMRSYENRNKIAIGCIVQWYEVEIAGFYVDSLLQAIESIDNQET